MPRSVTRGDDRVRTGALSMLVALSATLSVVSVAAPAHADPTPTPNPAPASAPTLTAIFDQSCTARSGSIALRLSPETHLELTMRTSNAAVVPETGLQMTRHGSLVELTVRPRTSASGVAKVTVTAQNTAGTATFVVRVVAGTSLDDTIVGSELTDMVFGRGGDDLVRGRAGFDLLCGGAGDDRLRGGPGRDTFLGQAGDDVMIGERDRNRFVGGAGRDSILE